MGEKLDMAAIVAEFAREYGASRQALIACVRRVRISPAVAATMPAPATVANAQIIGRGAGIDEEIKAERLERERRVNRIAALDEAVKLGQLVPSDRVRAEMTQLAREIDDEAAGMLADFATAIGSRFEAPQRDVLHLLRQVRRDEKAAAAERARKRAESLPRMVATAIEDGGAAA